MRGDWVANAYVRKKTLEGDAEIRTKHEVDLKASWARTGHSQVRRHSERDCVCVGESIQSSAASRRAGKTMSATGAKGASGLRTKGQQSNKRFSGQLRRICGRVNRR